MTEAVRVVRRLTATVGVAVVLMGVVLGLVPSYGAEGSRFGGVVDCGSPFAPAKNDLTDFGLGSCEAEGLATRRAWALAFIAAGAVLLVSAWTGNTLDEEPTDTP